MTETVGWGVGLATIASDGTVLDTWYPAPRIEPAPHEATASRDVDDSSERRALEEHVGEDARRDVRLELVATRVQLADAPASTTDAYLRLHLLSHRLVLPNSINLDGIFAQLPSVNWTNAGPILPETAARLRPALQIAGISTHSVDKFPRLLDYVTPPGVRIADANRVRLGAYLSPGTTVMHEGFVNFNAGTLGASMVEGRISQGVVVGNGSDIGGGASIMGTLSGGGTQRVVIGERALLGANSGIGISLGDDCVVEAGLYVTAGTKLVIADAAPTASGSPQMVKAESLSGRSGLLFRRNSLTGAVEVFTRTGDGIRLNAALHA